MAVEVKEGFENIKHFGHLGKNKSLVTASLQFAKQFRQCLQLSRVCICERLSEVTSACTRSSTDSSTGTAARAVLTMVKANTPAISGVKQKRAAVAAQLDRFTSDTQTSRLV